MYTTESQIEDFLKEYSRSRVVSLTMVNAVLKRALENEKKFKKQFYHFTKEEILKMFTNAKTKSDRSLQNWNLTLKHASRWFLSSANSAYEDITRDDLKTCIDVDAANQMLITQMQLQTIQDDIINYTDKAILSLLFLGVGGENLQEITFLTSDQLSKTEKKIYFKNGKMICLSDRDYDIIRNAFEEDSLVSYGDDGYVISVSTGGIYKIRSNTRNDNSNIHDFNDRMRRMRWLHRRVTLMSQYLGIKMTPKSINASGLWHTVNEKMKQKGITDVKEYLNTDSGRRVAWRYGFTGEHYVATLLDKYRKQL